MAGSGVAWRGLVAQSDMARCSVVWGAWWSARYARGGAVRCGVVARKGMALCGVAWRGATWRGVARRSVAWRDVAWRGVAWRRVAQYGVVWCPRGAVIS
ncbi:hypothetical protein TTRE_0000386001 [Trichuris trichiura]|uniref:Uncharacterized protein n=1 Tax=Trichuris trichiura TaxID=36087 RepID=A0A077Z524_TRITR|nr:hypothetical protein TTRE_0000386001 [Trichuris trichiura]